jgi:hypothetical protein
MSNHNTFILSPITDILRNVVTASAGIGSGIETYPLCDYVMQSVFLKMTGFQEQKMKCICWELATNDYEYRYDRYTIKTLGECSKYEEKSLIYQDIVKQIEKLIGNFDISSGISRIQILTETTTEIKSIFLDTNLSIWAQKRFNEFDNIWSGVSNSYFANDKNNLFTAVNGGISLTKIYKDHLYKHRNRCAHNLQSYQQNLPTLKTLEGDNYKYENYFVWFAILVLIDKIFIELYEKYLNALKEN